MTTAARDKARIFARKLRAEGKTYAQISKALFDAGHKGQKGKLLSLGGVRLLVNVKNGKRLKKPHTKNRTKTVSAAPVAFANPEKSRVNGMVSILKTNLPASERIALALLLGEAK